MPEIKAYTLSHKEILAAILEHQDIHEGIWQLSIEFSLAALNVQSGDNEVVPAAVVGVKKVGITRVEKESPIAIDAAKINPKA